MNQPTVSIACVSYNHENYISDAIEGFLMQETDFNFEIIIGDDCSTDGTKSILEKYKSKYPEKIRIISSVQNRGSLKNNIKVISTCKGKYIAFCDGDDYWTDPLKLQKQVDFLEANSDYVMTYSDVSVVDEKNLAVKDTDKIIQQKFFYKSGDIFWDLFRNSFINTNTTCVRSDIILALLHYVNNYKKDKRYIYDYWLWLHVAKKGKVKFMNEKMAAYRIHDQRISRKSYFEKRWPLVKLDVVFSLKKEEVDEREKKNYITRILLSSLRNKNVDFKLKSRALKYLFTFPPSIPFVVEELSKK